MIELRERITNYLNQTLHWEHSGKTHARLIEAMRMTLRFVLEVTARLTELGTPDQIISTYFRRKFAAIDAELEALGGAVKKLQLGELPTDLEVVAREHGKSERNAGLDAVVLLLYDHFPSGFEETKKGLVAAIEGLKQKGETK